MTAGAKLGLFFTIVFLGICLMASIVEDNTTSHFNKPFQQYRESQQR